MFRNGLATPVVPFLSAGRYGEYLADEMKIFVCIKQVPDVSAAVQSGRRVLNAYDASALEAALVLSEQRGGEVHLVLVGGAEAKETIRKALAMGATAAVHLVVEDDVPSDSLAVANVLARYLRDKDFDLITCGKQSQDTDSGLAGAMLAEILCLPYVSNAVGLDFEEGGTALVVKRQGDVGREILKLPLPGLITCSNDMNNPRIATLRGIMEAKRKNIPENPACIDTQLSTRTIGFYDVPKPEPGIVLEGDADEGVAALIKHLSGVTSLF